jgi:hypothetical protein
MERTDNFHAQLLDEQTGYSVVIDDDGEKAYAYLLDAAEVIVGDVWLYNCGQAPKENDWSDPAKLPFSNPAEFVSDVNFDPIANASEVSIQWKQHPGRPFEVLLSLRGELFAILQHGVKPGWSRLAIKDGPLAKVLNSRCQV